MDKETIEKRLTELKKSLEQVTANGNALVGAIQECEYWLKRAEEEEKEKTDENQTN
jgi:hypothetical protein